MRKLENNFAFIDCQNIYLGILELGWKIDWKRFRVYLAEKYAVKKAFLFLGFLESNQGFYRKLREFGFEMIFKEVLRDRNGKIKGNCDAELVLQTMIELENFDRAVIVSGDGDFACLVRFLSEKEKLRKVLVPDPKRFSALLKRAAGKQLEPLDLLRGTLSTSEKPRRAREAFQ